MTGDEIRTVFLNFFEEKGHKIMPSSSLVPQGDPTLLFTSAGMVPFKPYYLGEKLPPSPRLASCQKCFRTTDIESVGDPHHLTFFEMLGNFSVGDYFKQEAISWAWEFVTRHLELDPWRLWITIFLDDDESFRYWQRLGVPEGRILRFGEEDNFWGPAGSSGPCGPCSEILYDLGEGVGCRQASCAPGCVCGRFSEIWNLVFTQYNQDENGRRTLLPKPNIDTGMGLERTAAAIQGKASVYETDLFMPLLECISELAGIKYGADNDVDNTMRIIAEHGRGITFLIGDGVIPSNEGQGYVLRRLLRRAALFSRRLGVGIPFVAEAAKTTVEQMGHIYPEIVQREGFIIKVIESEQARFSETLSVGLNFVNKSLQELACSLIANPVFRDAARQYQEIGKQIQKVMPSPEIVQTIGKLAQQYQEIGKQIQKVMPSPEIVQTIGKLAQQYQGLLRIPSGNVFKLYDTYGFPVELTEEIASRQGFSVDKEGFEKEMERQRERARTAHKFTSKAAVSLTTSLTQETNFVGYESLECNSTISHLLLDNDFAKAIEKGQEAGIILDSTPFYAEMGGQVGDTGEIVGPSGRFVVTNTIKAPQGFIIHHGYVAEGNLSVGDEVEAVVDKERRLDIARNHTATHLLQSALRQVLGEHVQQRGSLVTPERLRFDFSHLVAMTKEEIQEVNHAVNDRIRQNLEVHSEETSCEKAIGEGALALFDEKYGEKVRVVKIGEPVISAELCGGTHVTASTGEIGFFHIISESSIGAGLRRIEAVTGRGAEEFIDRHFSSLDKIAESLGASPGDVPDKVSSLVTELEKERRQALALERELSKKIAASLLNQVEVVNGVKVLVARVPSYRIEALRGMSDLLRERLKSVVIVLGTIYDNKPVFLAAVTPDLVAKGYNAGEIVNQVARVTGGGGGGKAQFAQAGGKYKDKLDEALKLVKSLI